MRNSISISHVSAGLTAAIVGYAGAAVIVINAAEASGASPVQVGSWLFTLGIAMGLVTIAYSLMYKVPVLVAWSTPGAALLISCAGGYSLGEVIGACIVAGGLIVLTGMAGALSRLLNRIPPAITAGMLAGILLEFGLRAFAPLQDNTALCVGMLVSYYVGKRFFSRYAMLMLLLVGGGITYMQGNLAIDQVRLAVSGPVLMPPVFSWEAAVGIGLPLYLVTMVSQNLPGMVMLQTHKYFVPTSRVLVGTGLVNMLTAPFGGFSCNLAAISAGICLGNEAGKDRSARYWATVFCGLFYFIAGIFGASVAALFAAMPAALIQMLAGFALLGTILSSFQDSMRNAATREAALVTLLITASGASLLGISSTVWGLLGGMLTLQMLSLGKVKKAEPVSAAS